MQKRILGSTLAIAMITLSGCEQPTDQLLRSEENGQEICEGRHITTPAMVETITTQTEVSPAQYDAAGKIIAEAVYQTKTQQRITDERIETRFQAVCPSVMSEEFLSSLQRALAARNLYQTGINGRHTQATKTAIKAYQTQSGLESEILSIETARQLGLVTVDLNEN